MDIQMQYNKFTMSDYGGYNQLSLLTAKDKNGYVSNAWMTYLQAKLNGLQVKKGSHGVKISSPFMSNEVKDAKTGEIKKTTFIPKTYTVFNEEQTEATAQTEVINQVSKNFQLV